MKIDKPFVHDLVQELWNGRGNGTRALLQFDLSRDLIYGVSDDINAYWDVLQIAQKVKRDIAKTKNFTSKRLSDLKAYAWEFYEKPHGHGTRQDSNIYIQWRESQDHLDVGGNRNELSMGLVRPSGGERENFFNRFQNSKYGVENTHYLKVDKGVRKDNPTLSDTLDDDDYYTGNNLANVRNYMVRRACKFLMYDTIQQRGGRIFYALDGLDLNDVANKTARTVGGKEKVPVCTSEIREIFRMWAFLKSHLTFYRDFVPADPPWTRNLAAWSQYAKSRAAKSNIAKDELEAVEKQTDPAEVIKLYHAIPYNKLQSPMLPYT